MICKGESVNGKPELPIWSWTLWCILSVLVAFLPSPSAAQAIPDSMHNRLLAVFGEGPLADSTMAVLARAREARAAASRPLNSRSWSTSGWTRRLSNECWSQSFST
jgi:hypothetical protein